ncbi:shikimate dehydrogenase [Amphritea atlantica]|uniref:Shikimate dehydrogenase (NADP(+)) n=1 Tax=Amphritea atlantica TaxID=355243 RepID=A0ABY5GWC1_9GAMM|nr:shikimate dehydrogenase [Amphritea atlantica]
MNKNFLSNLTGSFAMPAMENPTVAMVEAAYQHHQLDWRYINCEVSPELLKDAVRGARAMGWAGFNCSIPHKVAVIEHLDGLGQSAMIIGAVNTVVRNARGEYIGENTDGRGFVTALNEVTDPQGAQVILFGAGGAARAVAVEMAFAGAAHITVVNRSRERGEKLTRLICKKTPATATFAIWDGDFRLPADTDIVINATSIGLYPNIDQQLDINWETLSSDMVVADGIHNPPMTPLLRTAQQKGCKCVNGQQMLVHQGAIGIHYWTGIEVDTRVMYQALREIFNPE